MCLRGFMLMWSSRVVVLAAFDCCLDLLGCDVYLSWIIGVGVFSLLFPYL